MANKGRSKQHGLSAKGIGSQSSFGMSNAECVDIQFAKDKLHDIDIDMDRLHDYVESGFNKSKESSIIIRNLDRIQKDTNLVAGILKKLECNNKSGFHFTPPKVIFINTFKEYGQNTMIKPKEGLVNAHGYILRQGPRGGWRWEHPTDKGRYVPVGQKDSYDWVEVKNQPPNMKVHLQKRIKEKHGLPHKRETWIVEIKRGGRWEPVYGDITKERATSIVNTTKKAQPNMEVRMKKDR